MKRTLMLTLGALLVVNSVTFAAPGDQDKNERPRRITLSGSGYLGVAITEVTKDVAGRLQLREERGALITGVTNGTAAEKAGLQKDDVIVKWNGESLESASELGRRIRETPAGRSVKLGILRQGHEMDISVTLDGRNAYPVPVRVANLAPLARLARPATIISARDGYRLGISLQGMSPQLAEYFGLKNRNGALVTFVHPDSAAAKAGVKAGDVILSIGGETVENPMQALQVLSRRGEGTVEVKVMRDRQERTLTVPLEKGKTSMNWQQDDDGDVVVSAALVEPFEIGPMEIGPINLAPMAVPQINLAPMVVPEIHFAPLNVPEINLAPMAVPEIPEIHIAPMVVPEINMAPMVMPRINVAPMAMPKIAIPRIKIPKMNVPPMRIVVPDGAFRIQV